MDNQYQESPNPSVLTKIVFGIGSSAETVHIIAFNVFCFYFYSQVVGLHPSLVGLSIGIALLVDAVSDPLIGLYSDRLKSRFGRRHTLMLISALPTAVAFWLLFSPPIAILGNNLLLFLYLTGCIIALRVSLTFFIIPHISFGAEMVPDYVGRSKVMAYHTLFLWIGGAAVLYFGLDIFFAPSTCELANCMDSIDNYVDFGAFWGVSLFVLILITTLGTMHRVKYLHAVENEVIGPISWDMIARRANENFQEFKSVFQNPNYRAILFGMLCLALTSGVQDAMSTYMIKFYWELTTDQFKLYAFCTAFGFIFTFIVTPKLHRTFGKKNVMFVVAFCQSVTTLLPIGLRMLGWYPENHTPALFPLMLFFTGTYYFFHSILILTVVSALGDVADQHELNYQIRREGLFFSARNFFGKLATGGGTIIGGLGLTLIAFPVGETNLEKISQADVNELGYVYGIASLFALISAYFYSKYAISETDHNEILEKIDQNKESALQV